MAFLRHHLVRSEKQLRNIAGPNKVTKIDDNNFTVTYICGATRQPEDYVPADPLCKYDFVKQEYVYTIPVKLGDIVYSTASNGFGLSSKEAMKPWEKLE